MRSFIRSIVSTWYRSQNIAGHCLAVIAWRCSMGARWLPVIECSGFAWQVRRASVSYLLTASVHFLKCCIQEIIRLFLEEFGGLGASSSAPARQDRHTIFYQFQLGDFWMEKSYKWSMIGLFFLCDCWLRSAFTKRLLVLDKLLERSAAPDHRGSQRRDITSKRSLQETITRAYQKDHQKSCQRSWLLESSPKKLEAAHWS